MKEQSSGRRRADGQRKEQRKVTRSALECGSGAAETLLGFSLPLELPSTAISSTGGE